MRKKLEMFWQFLAENKFNNSSNIYGKMTVLFHSYIGVFQDKLFNIVSLFFQTISNGTVSNNKDSILRDIRDRGDQEKENTDVNIQNNSATHTLDTLSSSSKESRTKKKDNSSRQSKSVIPNANIPKFHFPMGRPSEKDDTEEILLRVSQEFSKVEGGKISKQQMAIVSKVIL